MKGKKHYKSRTITFSLFKTYGWVFMQEWQKFTKPLKSNDEDKGGASCRNNNLKASKG